MAVLLGFSEAPLFILHMIVMDEGVVVADGKLKEILADAKLLEAHGLEKP